MEIVFAANAGASDGSGHFKRCIEYAASLDRTKYSSLIFGKCEFQWLKDFAINKQVRTSTNHRFTKDSILIIDSYSRTFIEEVFQKAGSRNAIQIADPFTPLLPSSKIIWFDPGEPPEYLSGRVVASGTKYFPIQKVKSARIQPEVAKHVLISVGGTQQSKILNNLIAAIELNLFMDTVFHVIGNNEFGSKLQNNFEFHPFGSYISNLLDLCDTAISATGISAWDFLANGLLLGYFKFVENQGSNFSFLNQEGLGMPLSSDGLHFPESSIKALIQDTRWRTKMNPSAIELFDFDWRLKFNNLIDIFSGSK